MNNFIVLILVALLFCSCCANFIKSDSNNNSNNGYQELTDEQYKEIENQVDACFDGTGPCKQEWLDARDGKL